MESPIANSEKATPDSSATNARAAVIFPLRNGRETLVDSEWLEYLNQWEWRVGSHGYACRGERQAGKYVQILMHRVISKATPKEETDHRNRNRLDNRQCNLRNASGCQNRHNTGRTNWKAKSKFKGVETRPDGLHWKAEIRANGQRRYLGYFDNELAAAIAYDVAAKQLHGEYAKLNFPPVPTPVK